MTDARATLATAIVLWCGAALAETRILDADTIDLAGDRVRLHGIDAPETRQACLLPDGREWRCGVAATDALAAYIAGRPVTCNALDIDRYGRTIGRCYVEGQDINRWLVSEGWAVAYRRFSMDYVADEDAARAAGRGIWAAEFVMPWDWRQGERIVEVAEQQPGCLIKGNINGRGERIYHEPGGRWYERTQIDTSKGQRWFCSREEAEAAGWRRAGS